MSSLRLSRVSALAACLSALPWSAIAQQSSGTGSPDSVFSVPNPAPSVVVTPPPGPVSSAGYPGMTPSARFGGTSQLAQPAPTPQEEAFAAGEGLLQWGFAHIFPHLAYGLSYGNSLSVSAGDQANTLINTLSPGILMQLGSHWTLDYTPTLRFYSDSRFQDGVDHAVVLSGNTVYKDWVLGLSQSYSSSSQPLVETAAQTDQEVFLTTLTASHPLNSKLSLDLSVDQSFRSEGETSSVQPLTDVKEWSTMDWLNYQLEPTIVIGAGVGFTYDDMSVGPNMTSEQYQGRVTWIPTRKLSLTVSGGLNDMQFLDSPIPDLLSPIYSVSANYALFENTALFVTASRTVSPSYFESQVTEGTFVTGGVQQRLLGKFMLGANGGFSSSVYHATTIGPLAASVSNYDTSFFNISLSTTFLKRLSTSVFYNAQYLSSNSSAYNYSTFEVGLNLGYRF